jgi:hypothetical protein
VANSDELKQWIIATAETATPQMLRPVRCEIRSLAAHSYDGWSGSWNLLIEIFLIDLHFSASRSFSTSIYKG